MKPALFAFFAAVMWGLWWIPIRWLENLGLGGAAGGVAMNAGAFLGGLVWLVVLRPPLRISTRALGGAVLVGLAVTAFSTSLTMTTVVRAVLLFYLAPAWSKIIEWALLGLPWRWTSTVALVSALAGAALLLGGDVNAGQIGAGDALALASGLAWAAGAALIFTGGQSDAALLTTATALAAVSAGLGFIWLTGAQSVSVPFLPAGAGMIGGVIYVLPILFLTLWSAQRLPPAVLSFLLTAEILAGVLSGVAFLDEPFGLVQAAGAGLIILGALAEILPALARKT